MTDTTNVVSLPGADDPDAGFRQQRYRRKQSKPRQQRKQRKTSPSETPKAADSAENTSVLPVTANSENANAANDMVTLSERPPNYGSQRATRDTSHAEFRPEHGPGFDAIDTFRSASTAERLLILIAAGLSGTAAYMSVSGMGVLYPSEPAVIMVFGGLIEAVKFVGFGVLAAGWRSYSFTSRWVAAMLLLVAAMINASGVYGRLISNHAGPAAGRTAAFTEQDAATGARLEVASGRLADVDRQIALIDATAEGAAKRGKAKTAAAAIDQQKRQRAALATERQQAAQEVANLKAGRSGQAARHAEDEAATLPVKHAAALFEDVGLLKPGSDPEQLIRWLSLMLLLSGDPLALALMVTINSRSRRAKP